MRYHYHICLDPNYPPGKIYVRLEKVGVEKVRKADIPDIPRNKDRWFKGWVLRVVEGSERFYNAVVIGRRAVDFTRRTCTFTGR